MFKVCNVYYQMTRCIISKHINSKNETNNPNIYNDISIIVPFFLLTNTTRCHCSIIHMVSLIVCFISKKK